MAFVPKNQPLEKPRVTPPISSTDLTFFTNEPDRSLRDRFGVILRDGTRTFDCLVGYFFISGFYKLYFAYVSCRAC